MKGFRISCGLCVVNGWQSEHEWRQKGQKEGHYGNPLARFSGWRVKGNSWRWTKMSKLRCILEV
jgi:hypothetical protein